MTKHKKNIKTTSLEDFKSYLTDKLSEKEQHALEKRWIDDDFEREAMEGFEKFNIHDVEKDLSDIGEKTGGPVQGKFPYLKIAAVVALFISVTVVFFILLKPYSSPELSKEASPSTEQTDKNAQAAKSAPDTKADSTLIAQQYVQPEERGTTSSKGRVKDAVSANKNEIENLAKADENEPNSEGDSEHLSEIVVEEASATEDFSIDTKDYSIEKIHPIKETELEPIPETGNFNRIASAKVKPSQNPALNSSKEDLPERLEYPEGINELPEAKKKENLSATSGVAKSLSRSANTSAADAKPAAPAEEREYFAETDFNAHPEGGYDSYYEYVYEKIRSQELLADKLPDTVNLRILLNARGNIKEISFLTETSNDFEENLRKILFDGPKWTVKSGKNEVVDLVLEFKD